MRSLILLACITWMSMSIVTSASSATTPETESFKTAALSSTMAPPASGYMDMWIRDSQGCEREAGPITFTPCECFYVPFLANFSSTYFTAPQQDGYAIVFYSSDNNTAFLYAYEDEQCQKYSNWSYSTPVATQQCANYTGPNIWPSEGSFGPSAPAWPADQFTAPIGMDYHTGTCDPYNMNGLSLGFCYGAGSASPSAVFCSAEEGTWVTFVQYASGSNCEPQNAIGTKLVQTGCNAVQQSDFTCPDVSGPTAPTIDYDSITLNSSPIIHAKAQSSIRKPTSWMCAWEIRCTVTMVIMQRIGNTSTLERAARTYRSPSFTQSDATLELRLSPNA